MAIDGGLGFVDANNDVGPADTDIEIGCRC